MNDENNDKEKGLIVTATVIGFIFMCPFIVISDLWKQLIKTHWRNIKK